MESKGFVAVAKRTVATRLHVNRCVDKDCQAQTCYRDHQVEKRSRRCKCGADCVQAVQVKIKCTTSE